MRAYTEMRGSRYTFDAFAFSAIRPTISVRYLPPSTDVLKSMSASFFERKGVKALRNHIPFSRLARLWVRTGREAKAGRVRRDINPTEVRAGRAAARRTR